MGMIKTVTVTATVEDLRIGNLQTSVTDERVRVRIAVDTEMFDHRRVHMGYTCAMELNDFESRFDRYAAAVLRKMVEALKTLPQEADEYFTLTEETLDIRRKFNQG